jgi:hypothetical protein
MAGLIDLVAPLVWIAGSLFGRDVLSYLAEFESFPTLRSLRAGESGVS